MTILIRRDDMSRPAPTAKIHPNNAEHLFVRIIYFSPAVMEKLLVQNLRAVQHRGPVVTGILFGIAEDMRRNWCH